MERMDTLFRQLKDGSVRNGMRIIFADGETYGEHTIRIAIEKQHCDIWRRFR